jgi:hypothetical protein
MSITYTIAIDLNDNGNFADSGDIITPDVLALHWRLGMERPYESVAALSRAEITVLNRSGNYSPERTALLPGKRVRLQSNDGTLRTHFTGFIERVEPTVGSYGKQTAVIHVHGVEQWLAQNQITLAPLVNVRADQVIQAVLQRCHARYPVLSGYLILDSGTVGEKLFGEPFTYTLEQGKSTFAYVGDQWGTGIPAAVALRQAAESERGRLFVNRAGEIQFYQRHHTLQTVLVSAAFSDTMQGMTYEYGGAVVNQVSVTITPRSSGTPNSTLWSLDAPQKLLPQQVHRITARYQDANQNPLGALQVNTPLEYSANTLSTGQGADKTALVQVNMVQADFSAAVLEIWHTEATPLYLTALTLKGTPLITGDALTLTETSAASRTQYGFARLALALPLLTNLEDAVNIARFELQRRSEPRGSVLCLELNAPDHLPYALSLSLFDRIQVIETHSGHSADYFIIAEEHSVDQGGARHRVRWLLEPAEDDRFFILDQNLLDGTRTLLY